MWQRAMRILDDNDAWLSDDGWIIVQIHPVEREELALNCFERFDERKYGSTLLMFFCRKGASFPVPALFRPGELSGDLPYRRRQ